MQIILFYGRDGAKAKQRAKELKNSKSKVMVCDVTVWEGTKDGDQAEIMDCVSYFDRQRIEHVFGQVKVWGRKIQLRSIGLARAKLGIGMKFLVYNLARWRLLQHKQQQANLPA